MQYKNVISSAILDRISHNIPGLPLSTENTATASADVLGSAGVGNNIIFLFSLLLFKTNDKEALSHHKLTGDRGEPKVTHLIGRDASTCSQYVT